MCIDLVPAEHTTDCSEHVNAWVGEWWVCAVGVCSGWMGESVGGWAGEESMGLTISAPLVTLARMSDVFGYRYQWAVHLYQLSPEVQASGLSEPSSMPNSLLMSASTATASLSPTPSANSFPDAKAHSGMTRKLKKAMYLHQVAACQTSQAVNQSLNQLIKQACCSNKPSNPQLEQSTK